MYDVKNIFKNTFRHIVVGLDLDAAGESVTEGSAKAAAQAVWVARASGGRVLFLHSTFHDEYHDAEQGDVPLVREGCPQSGWAALEREVDAARRRGVAADLALTSERVWLDITRMALRGEADLAVVGKRSESTGVGRKLGSVATKLLRKCPSAVWAVKPEHDLMHRLVLAASDLSPVGDRSSRCAAQIARLKGCELHVVHAYQVPLELQIEAARMSDLEYGEELEQLRARAVAHIRRSVAEIVEHPGEGLEVHVGKGAPSTVIREAVAHLDPDLLVMGMISRGGLAGLLVGSTAERLLDRLDCSILAIKPEDFVSPVRLE